MMQTADQRHLDHVPTVWRLHRPRDWTVVRERSMRADFMIIFEVGFENLPQLPFIEHDHSIQTFAPNRTYQPLDVRVLPRRPRGDQLLLDAHALNPLHKDRSVDRIAVSQQILGRCVFGERIDDLLRGPRCRWRIGNVEMNDLRRSWFMTTNT